MKKRELFEPRLLTGHYYKEGPKYRFTLLEDLIIYIHKDIGNHKFSDINGNIWLETEERIIKVSANYSTDGCSPKFKVFGNWIGTPDFEWTRIASTVHDAFYQFAHISCCPLTRNDADWLFYELMLMDIDRLKVKNPRWAKIIAGGYRNAVMSAGIPFYHYGTLTKGRTGTCLVHQTT